ncbi:MAG: hypothetical protein GWN79_29445 [Actinobacteria bacterium]|nr:hypothetical protein [Actinomycetota bacterium]NIS37504.1 hypothetical protein [Actinomycetota bacterium]NIT99314.1 hypothetical protein [Actinomycetota bacterium]NIU22911.1 hypothetical protein [Actinomycetota bacterium]NIU71915.1 hypothetical protein [Actinomycetota bacterium]
MRTVLVPLFYVWVFGALGVLVHRRVTTGTFRPSAGDGTERGSTTPVTVDHAVAPPLRGDGAPDGSAASGAAATVTDPPTSELAVEDRPATLAEAVDGISMPCGLVPVGGDRLDPRHVAFSTTGHEPATVGTAMADELERLGYAITPLDDRSVRAERPGVELEVKIWSARLDSGEVMAERFPSVGSHALVVDLRVI